MAESFEDGKEPSGSIKMGNFMSNRVTVSFSRRTLLHSVS
jgi:hypothetical protein